MHVPGDVFIETSLRMIQVTNETAAQHVVRFSSSAHVYIPPRWEPALKLLKAERDRIVPQPSQPQPSTSAGLPALSPADTSESRQGSQSQSQKLPKSPYNPGSPGGMQIPPAALEPRMQKLPGRLGPGRLGTQQSQQSQQGQHTSQHGPAAAATAAASAYESAWPVAAAAAASADDSAQPAAAATAASA